MTNRKSFSSSKIREKFGLIQNLTKLIDKRGKGILIERFLNCLANFKTGKTEDQYYDLDPNRFQ